MEVFRSDDNTVGKYIHNDLSETSIKCVSSCDTIVDPATGLFYNNSIDRKKYTVFVSSSVGCFMNCNFCYLTIKNSAYGKIAEQQLLKNLQEAVEQELIDNPSNRDRFAKICWMGMGEDHMIHPERTRSQTIKMLDWMLAHNYTLGLDGVDIATVMSKATSSSWIDQFTQLDRDLGQYALNPLNTKDVHASNAYTMGNNRSRLRLFYSLHSAQQNERDQMIPNALSLNKAVSQIDEFYHRSNCNVIFHYMFMEGQNDSDASVDALLEFMQHRKHHELRILRYNSCSYTPFDESPKFNAIIAKLAKEIPRLKVQISVGKEVAAACGQFIVKGWAHP